MKMDKSTYIFNGNTYGKGRLVLAVVEQYVSDNHGLAKKELEESFPSALQGSIGVISSIEEAEGKYKGKRHFVKNAIKLSNATVAVCNQWGSKNIDKFVQHAAGELGYNIDIEFEADKNLNEEEWMSDLQGFRDDKGVEDYYKSERDLYPEEGEIEWFFDNLKDATDWSKMKKGETKEVGTISADCVDRIENSIEIRGHEDDDCVKGEILLRLIYDEWPDDTIKLRFKYEAAWVEDDVFEIIELSIFYLDHEGHDFPYDYSVFQDLYAAVKAAA
jgi:hypothetical protein